MGKCSTPRKKGEVVQQEVPGRIFPGGCPDAHAPPYCQRQSRFPSRHASRSVISRSSRNRQKRTLSSGVRRDTISGCLEL